MWIWGLPARLTVCPPRRRRRFPDGATIYASVFFTLTPTVSGTLPLNYQWQYNTVSNLATAVNIPGNRRSYAFNPPVVTNTGWYDVIVTNFAVVTSAPVLLTVLQPQPALR